MHRLTFYVQAEGHRCSLPTRPLRNRIQYVMADLLAVGYGVIDAVFPHVLHQLLAGEV